MINDLIGYRYNKGFLPLSQCGPTILDFGFIHSDATYDVCPVYNGKAFALQYHLNRFISSAEYYKLELPDINPIEIIKELYKRNQPPHSGYEIKDAFIWMIIWRGHPPSGNPRDIENAPIEMCFYMKPSYPLSIDGRVMNVHLSDHLRVSDEYYRQEYKNFGWIEMTKAQLDRPEGTDTVLLQSYDEGITEGPGFNVGFVYDDTIFTPLKHCLEGVTMRMVGHICEDHKYRFISCRIKNDIWDIADEIFLTSSSGGVTATQRSGKITKWLQKEYLERTKSDEWTTEL